MRFIAIRALWSSQARVRMSFLIATTGLTAHHTNTRVPACFGPVAELATFEASSWPWDVGAGVASCPANFHMVWEEDSLES